MVESKKMVALVSVNIFGFFNVWTKKTYFVKRDYITSFDMCQQNYKKRKFTKKLNT